MKDLYVILNPLFFSFLVCNCTRIALFAVLQHYAAKNISSSIYQIIHLASDIMNYIKCLRNQCQRFETLLCVCDCVTLAVGVIVARSCQDAFNNKETAENRNSY